ncbi:hypothetical protein [Thermoplasma sp.]|uniref:hypothetical protein n=1 Tax=Thermoplasma sp. TaxID=1973142 RepID=UPI00127DDCB5|nr:hypothetical protein [Thermoplasma sp.]KAA8921908.1 MAG: hypothetical protein F6Q11_07095 [Thermoplasma sp.]
MIRTVMARVGRAVRWAAIAVVIVLAAAGSLYALYRSQESVMRFDGVYHFASMEIMEKGFNVSGYFGCFHVIEHSSIIATSDFAIVIISYSHAGLFLSELRENFTTGNVQLIAMNNSYGLRALIMVAPNHLLSPKILVYGGHISSGEYTVLLINPPGSNNTVTMDIAIYY